MRQVMLPRTMRQLNYLRPGTLEWHDVPAPTLTGPGSALVRPLVVSTCDMDGVVISGAAPFRGPLPVGHEGVAEVVDVGDAVTSVAPGDRVLVPWKISCGACAACRRGRTAHCESVPKEAAYSWGPTAVEYGGFLADLVLVPFADHMLCPVPSGVDELAAVGVTDNITDAWRAVGPPLAGRPDATVLVAGGGGPGSIGLFAAGLAAALGAGLVVYADPDGGRRETAAGWGATALASLDELPGEPRRFDVTVDASGDPRLLHAVVRRTAPGGLCTSTTAATYAAGDVPLPLLDMYRHSVTLTTGWVDTRPLMAEPLALIADGRFDPAPAFTAVATFDDAPEALAQPFTKLLFRA